MPVATPGQTQALNELSRIIEVSNSRLEGVSKPGLGIDGAPELSPDGAVLRVDLWVDCSGASADRSGGRDLLEREPLTLYIPADFPFRGPVVKARHRDFAGLPHVQWGSIICLYASAHDWDPGDGMWGFIDRLLTWYLRAAQGRLSGPALPWHPPVTYRSGHGGVIVIGSDLPDGYERDDALWTGWGVVAPGSENRFELREWVPAAVTGSRPDGLRLHMAARNRNSAAAGFLVPLVALPESLGFEYPTTLGDLHRALAAREVDFVNCMDLVIEAATINGDSEVRARTGQDGSPLVLLIGSPAADRTTTPGRVAHLAAWRISPKGLARGGGAARVDWMRVYDQRPRATTRRDASRPVEWLTGRRVLLLGCGALGAPIAEHCVRAGVRTLTLVDNGAVNPGILVRQPYRYADIGRSKATALRERLCAIAPHVTINGHFDNALDMFADEAALSSADLVVDATADRSLAARIERLRWTSKKPSPPILSVMVGHRSERGIATLALQRSTGAGADILRRLAIAASGDGDLVDVLDDFYPDPPRGDMFQPEPGCSDPTFIGSAADLAILAAQLLNAGLTMLSGAPAPEAQLPTRTATVVRLPTGLLPEAAGVRLQWSNDVVRDEDVHGYQVRIEPAALADMRREVVRAAAADHRDETGGVLLGQVDHGCRVVWVSEAYGLPPDSQAAPGGLRLNVADLQYRLSERRRGSRGMVGLIGAWHSHPAGAVVPSERDRQTMDDLVNGESEALSQALLVIVGGTDGRWREWIDGTAAPDMHVEMFFPRQQ